MEYLNRGKDYNAQNGFELVELFNDEMEEEVGFQFSHSLHCAMSAQKTKGSPFSIPHLHWYILRHADMTTQEIGEYMGDDADFMKRFLHAHRKSFAPMLKKTLRWTAKQIQDAYRRWHNRAMRTIPDLETDEDLLAAQDDQD